jgi:hypothetical protein
MVKLNEKVVGAVTVRAFVLGLLLSGVFAWVIALRDNVTGGSEETYLAGNVSPVLPYIALLIAGVLINPLLKRLKLIRILSKEELLLIFVMCFVSGVTATWGLSGSLVPTIAGLSNQAWNTDQSRWDVSGMAFLNEKYFIAEEGTQAAAKELRKVHLQHEEMRRVYQTARDLQLGEAELARIEQDRKLIAAVVDPEERAASERAMVWPFTQATKLVEMATEKWAEVGDGLDPQVVVDTYSEKIEALKVERDAMRAGLKELNADAFAAVEEVRKGLPEGKRGIPGVFYSSGEGKIGYTSRIQRLKVGSKSLDRVELAQAELAEATAAGERVPVAWSTELVAAADLLAPISDIPALNTLNGELTGELTALEDRIVLQDAQMRQLRHLRRHSKQSEFEAYEEQIKELESELATLNDDAKQLRDRVEIQVRPLLAVCGLVQQTRDELVALADEAGTALPSDYPALQERLAASMATYTSFDATARRFWLGDARWGLWVGPICNWLVIIFLGYMIFMTFNTLIFRQWAHNEKLIYPLAEVTTLVAGGGEPDEDGKTLFGSGLFWFGFCLALGILGWNFLAKEGIITNINPVKLEFGWWYHMGSGMFRGLNATYFCIIFVVIGVSFLIPSNISFSLWSFEILYMGLTVVYVLLGYGGNRQSMGHVRNGIGSGAVLIFGLVTLWTCRRYLLCAFAPRVLKGLGVDEAKELRWSSSLFVASVVALVSLLSFGLGANLFWVIMSFLITMIVAIAIVRAVSEGGILGIEGGAGLIMKGIFGMSQPWCAPILLAPMAAFSGFLMGHGRGFIAPMIANSLKIREEFKMRRSHFHIAIWSAIIIATVVSLVTLILISYDRGADNMDGWINTHAARAIIGSAQGMAEDLGGVRSADRRWFIAGAVLMGGLLFGRRRVFGIPHPLGLLMIMNRSMYGFWASIMIGWCAKHMVSKYCSHAQYVAVRRFFIGLVLGHLLAILFGWDSMAFHWG